MIGAAAPRMVLCFRSKLKFRQDEEQMKTRQPYKGYILEAMSHERSDGHGFVSEVYIENHGKDDVAVTPFYPKGTFGTHELALRNAILCGQYQVDKGFSPS
jgi:hypothetical protein